MSLQAFGCHMLTLSLATNTGFARDVILKSDTGIIIPINETVEKIKEAIIQ
jgi:hypothetical protein